jgi:hypothetical protein
MHSQFKLVSCKINKVQLHADDLESRLDQFENYTRKQPVPTIKNRILHHLQSSSHATPAFCKASPRICSNFHAIFFYLIHR